MEKILDGLGGSALIAGGLAMAMGIEMSADLHRNRTHKSYELDERAQRVGECVTWLLSGMTPLEWTVTHLTHHAFQDSEPNEEQWGLIQKAYPNAPVEAFRDPHSPVIEGYLNILFKNGTKYYPKASKRIVSYLRGLEADNVPREEWPPHLRNVDLNQSQFEKLIDKAPHGRMLGLVATGVGISALRGPKRGLMTMGIYIAAVLSLGGGVNSLGHTGKTDNIVDLLKVMVGTKKPVPDENGSFACDFAKHLEFFTAGEARHGRHHNQPFNPFITSENNYFRDPSSGLIKGLARLGLSKFNPQPLNPKPRNLTENPPYAFLYKAA